MWGGMGTTTAGIAGSKITQRAGSSLLKAGRGDQIAPGDGAGEGDHISRVDDSG